MLSRIASCCGIGELSGLDTTAQRSLNRMCAEYFAVYNITYKMIVFTDAVMNKGGVRLAKYIEENDLGKIVASDKCKNPNTRRNVMLWTWYPDIKKLRAWYKTQNNA